MSFQRRISACPLRAQASFPVALTPAAAESAFEGLMVCTGPSHPQAQVPQRASRLRSVQPQEGGGPCTSRCPQEVGDSASPHSSWLKAAPAQRGTGKEWVDTPRTTSNCESFTTARCHDSQHNLWRGIWPEEGDTSLHAAPASQTRSCGSSGRPPLHPTSSSRTARTSFPTGSQACSSMLPDLAATEECKQEPVWEEDDFGLLELASRRSWEHHTDSMLSAESSFNDPDTYGRMISDVESDGGRAQCLQHHRPPNGVLMQAVPCMTVP